MTWTLVLEQALNGLQFGVLLFLLSAGLTLVFGIMNFLNLAHGSLYMLGAYFAATFVAWTHSFVLGAVLALASVVAVGLALEAVALRRLYSRSHLDQLLATFGLILFFNELAQIVWGPAGLSVPVPALLQGHIEILPGVGYPAYRLMILGVGVAVAGLLYVMVAHTRAGMLIRAGASDRDMVQALGVNIGLVFAAVFGLGAALAGLAGIIAAPLLSVEAGMGEDILILAFVVIVVGGIGSIRGAFVAAVAIGLTDTLGRAFLPEALQAVLPGAAADAAGPALASMLIYIAMASVLAVRPQGLFAAKAG